MQDFQDILRNGRYCYIDSMQSVVASTQSYVSVTVID